MNSFSGHPVARLDELADGQLIEREAVLAGEVESVVLRRQGDSVQAWLNFCPHAGRRLDYAPNMFLLTDAGELVCPVHGATFELSEGNCTSGPCRGQSLRALDACVLDGQIQIRLKA